MVIKDGAPRQLLPAPSVLAKSWTVVGEQEGYVHFDCISLDTPNVEPFVRITLKRVPPPSFYAQILTPVRTKLCQGSVVRLSFWGRSKDNLFVHAVYGHKGPPYERYLSTPLVLTKKWTQYSVRFIVPRDTEGNWAQFAFLFPRTLGELEIRSVSLEDWGIKPHKLPKDVNKYINIFGGETNEEDWYKKARERIDRIRKKQLKIVVFDSRREPVPNAMVRVKQLRHGFRFGAAIAPEPLFDAGANGTKYRDTILNLFNCVVFENALKWSAQDYTTADTIKRMLDWCKTNALAVRGHNLLWPSYEYLPKRLKSLKGFELKEAIRQHIKRYVKSYRGFVYVWDVVNEGVTNHEFQDELGETILVDTFKWARESDERAKLAYNDYDILNNNCGANDGHRILVRALIARLIHANAPIDALGIQGHMSVPLTHGSKLWKILDEWSQFHMPIEITEYDLAVANDRIQAQYLHEFMTAAFSHPAVESFLTWSLWDGFHSPESPAPCMFRKDWTTRPVVSVYKNLVFKQWWTNIKMRTNENGEAQVKVFFGEHEVIASQGKKKIVSNVSVHDSKTPTQELVLTLR